MISDAGGLHRQISIEGFVAYIYAGLCRSLSQKTGDPGKSGIQEKIDNPSLKFQKTCHLS